MGNVHEKVGAVGVEEKPIPFFTAVERDASKEGLVIVKPDSGVLGDPDAEKARAFLLRFSRTLSSAAVDPLYALPAALVGVINCEVPGLLTADDIAFEKQLLGLCRGVGSIGIAEDSFVLSNHLLPIFCQEGAGEKVTVTTATRVATAAERHIQALYDLARPYLGWLLTNPEFLAERDRMRMRRLGTVPRQSFSLAFDGGTDREFREFLRKWNLMDLRSWDVPTPQGPNLAGFPLPSSAMNAPGAVNISVPSTVALPSGYPLQQMMTDARRLNTPRHLQEWQKILDRKVGSQGLWHFGQLFTLHFFLNIVLKSRYASRMNRQAARLDRAFADLMCLGEERVKQLRKHAAARITGR